MSLFVTFEGPEGGGKSTQARRVCAKLEQRGYHVLVTREPGGTPLGEEVRRVLLGSQYSDMLPETEALLNSAARAQHVAEVIRPALQSGQIVICDRFVDSTLAYQGAGRGLSIETLLRLQRFAVREVWPDLTILFDVPYEVGLARRTCSGEPLNRFDSDTQAFHQRVRDYFRGAASSEDERWRMVDASAPENDVEEQILSIILAKLEGAPVIDRTYRR